MNQEWDSWPKVKEQDSPGRAAEFDAHFGAARSSYWVVRVPSSCFFNSAPWGEHRIFVSIERPIANDSEKVNLRDVK